MGILATHSCFPTCPVGKTVPIVMVREERLDNILQSFAGDFPQGVQEGFVVVLLAF